MTSPRGAMKKGCGKPHPFLETESGLRYFCERRFRLRREAGKCSGVLYGDVSEDLAIQFDSTLFQSVDERAVAHAVQLGGRTDTHDPDRAILALLLFASGVGELECALD